MGVRTPTIPQTPARRPRSNPSYVSAYDGMSLSTIGYITPLRELLASGASHREIVRRLRLNLAIRLLLEAQAAADRDGAL